jgi:hypothetical protein
VLFLTEFTISVPEKTKGVNITREGWQGNVLSLIVFTKQAIVRVASVF